MPASFVAADGIHPAPPPPMDSLQAAWHPDQVVEIRPPSLPLACPPDPPPLMASRLAPPPPMASPQAHRHAQVVEIRPPSPFMEASSSYPSTLSPAHLRADVVGAHFSCTGSSFRPAAPHPTYGFGLTGYGDGIPYRMQYTAAPVGFGYGGSFLDLMAIVSARDVCHNARPHGNNPNQDGRDVFAKTIETVIIPDANGIPVEKDTGSNKDHWECNIGQYQDTSFPIMEHAHFDR